MNSHIVEKTVGSIKNVDRLTDLAAIEVYHTTHDALNKYEIMKEHATQRYTDEEFYQESVLAGVLIGAGVIGVAVSAFFIIKKIIDSKAKGSSESGGGAAKTTDLTSEQSLKKTAADFEKQINDAKIPPDRQVELPFKLDATQVKALMDTFSKSKEELVAITDASSAEDIHKVIENLNNDAITNADPAKIIVKTPTSCKASEIVSASEFALLIEFTKLYKEYYAECEKIEKKLQKTKKDDPNANIQVSPEDQKKLEQFTNAAAKRMNELSAAERKFIGDMEQFIQTVAKAVLDEENAQQQQQQQQQQQGENSDQDAQNKSEVLRYHPEKPDPRKIPETAEAKANKKTIDDTVNMLKSGKSEEDIRNALARNNYDNDKINAFLNEAKEIVGRKDKIIKALMAKGKSQTVATAIATDVCDKYNEDLSQYMNAQIAANPGDDKSAVWAKNEAYKNCMIIADVIGFDKASIPKPSQGAQETPEQQNGPENADSETSSQDNNGGEVYTKYEDIPEEKLKAIAAKTHPTLRYEDAKDRIKPYIRAALAGDDRIKEALDRNAGYFYQETIKATDPMPMENALKGMTDIFNSYKGAAEELGKPFPFDLNFYLGQVNPSLRKQQQQQQVQNPTDNPQTDTDTGSPEQSDNPPIKKDEKTDSKITYKPFGVPNEYGASLIASVNDKTAENAVRPYLEYVKTNKPSDTTESVTIDINNNDDVKKFNERLNRLLGMEREIMDGLEVYAPAGKIKPETVQTYLELLNVLRTEMVDKFTDWNVSNDVINNAKKSIEKFNKRYESFIKIINTETTETSDETKTPTPEKKSTPEPQNENLPTITRDENNIVIVNGKNSGKQSYWKPEQEEQAKKIIQINLDNGKDVTASVVRANIVLTSNIDQINKHLNQDYDITQIFKGHGMSDESIKKDLQNEYNTFVAMVDVIGGDTSKLTPPPINSDNSENSEGPNKITYSSDNKIIINGEPTTGSRSWPDDSVENEEASKIINYYLSQYSPDIAAISTDLLYRNTQFTLDGMKDHLNEKYQQINDPDPTLRLSETAIQKEYNDAVEICKILGLDASQLPPPPKAQQGQPQVQQQVQQQAQQQQPNNPPPTNVTIKNKDNIIQQASFDGIPDDIVNNICDNVVNDINSNTTFDVAARIKDDATKLTTDQKLSFADAAKRILKVYEDAAANIEPQTDPVKKYIEDIKQAAESDLSSLAPETNPEQLEDINAYATKIFETIRSIPGTGTKYAADIANSRYNDNEKQMIVDDIVNRLKATGDANRIAQADEFIKAYDNAINPPAGNESESKPSISEDTGSGANSNNSETPTTTPSEEMVSTKPDDLAEYHGLGVERSKQVINADIKHALDKTGLLGTINSLRISGDTIINTITQSISNMGEYASPEAICRSVDTILNNSVYKTIHDDLIQYKRKGSILNGIARVRNASYKYGFMSDFGEAITTLCAQIRDICAGFLNMAYNIPMEIINRTIPKFESYRSSTEGVGLVYSRWFKEYELDLIRDKKIQMIMESQQQQEEQKSE